MADKLITDLQELDAITGDTYVPVRNATAGTRKYNLKALKDTVDAAAQTADDAATDARAAAASVDASKEAAQQAAATANDASQRAEAAIEAIGDISELAVPLMSSTTRGGATLGYGLTVDGGALSIGDVVTDETNGPIYSVNAKGWAEQDGTPTPDNPQEVKVARGRNLLPSTAAGTWAQNGVTVTSDGYGAYTISGTSTAVVNLLIPLQSEGCAIESGDYVHYRNESINSSVSIGFFTASTASIAAFSLNAVNRSVAIANDKIGLKPAKMQVYVGANIETNITVHPSIEHNATPTPYVPYGHVGLEVRDSSDELVSVTPIPLPSKGFAAALPDGTADTLAIDSAGRYEWESVSDEVVFDGSSDEVWSGNSNRISIPFTCKKQASGTESFKALCNRFNAESPDGTYLGRIGFSSNTGGNSLFFSDGTKAMVLADWKTWLASNPVTVLYPLATPTTEHAYIDLPTIPEGATITCPELREVGVRCFVHGVSELVDHANNWGNRCKENESRIAALEAAIADLA